MIYYRINNLTKEEEIENRRTIKNPWNKNRYDTR